MLNALFKSYYSDYLSPHGKDITDSALRLNRVIRAARIPSERLAQFYTQSELGDFLLLLGRRIDVGPHNTTNPLGFGIKMIKAVLGEDNELLEFYIKEAEKRQKDK